MNEWTYTSIPPIRLRDVARDNFTSLPSIFIEKNEMGGACSVYGGGEKLIQCFGGET